MRKTLQVLFRFVIGAALAAGPAVVMADGAGAEVHGVSQAGCAHDPSDSGANHSSDNTPAPPIPVSASGNPQSASGGDGDPQCDTPAEESRQDR